MAGLGVAVAAAVLGQLIAPVPPVGQSPSAPLHPSDGDPSECLLAYGHKDRGPDGLPWPLGSVAVQPCGKASCRQKLYVPLGEPFQVCDPCVNGWLPLRMLITRRTDEDGDQYQITVEPGQSSLKAWNKTCGDCLELADNSAEIVCDEDFSSVYVLLIILGVLMAFIIVFMLFVAGTVGSALTLVREKTGQLTTPDGIYLSWCDIQLTRCQALTCAISFIIGLGFLLGLTLPMHTDDPSPYDRISCVVGWIYFTAWSVSFYPQVYFNWVRKSVRGMSFNFVFLNLVGFSCYSAYNCAYYWIDSVQNQYEDKHNGSSNVVRANDVFFALHATLITAVTALQILMYDRGDQRLHWLTIIAVVIALIVFLGWAIMIGKDVGVKGDWVDWFLGLSWLKLGISICKYMPQVKLNWTRKSTTGWNIWNVLLDFTGGSMSVAQQIMDCQTQHDWSGISGDPVKFGLGLTSMVFDVIFMFQHYVLYADNNKKIQEAEDQDRAPLLDEPESGRKGDGDSDVFPKATHDVADS